MISTYRTIDSKERLISSSEREGLPEEFPSYALSPKIIEKIYESISIQEDISSGKKEKVTRTIKRTQKQYITSKKALENSNWKSSPNQSIYNIPTYASIPLPKIKVREISEEAKKSYELAIQKEKDIEAEYQKKLRILNGEELPEPIKEMPQKSSQNSQSAWGTPLGGQPSDGPRKRFSVFVRNIPGYYKTQEITDILYDESRSCCTTPDKKYTGVKYVKVPEHRPDDREEKFYIAFVEFYSEEEAQKFIDKRVAIDGTFLNKSWSREK